MKFSELTHDEKIKEIKLKVSSLKNKINLSDINQVYHANIFSFDEILFISQNYNDILFETKELQQKKTVVLEFLKKPVINVISKVILAVLLFLLFVSMFFVGKL